MLGWQKMKQIISKKPFVSLYTLRRLIFNTGFEKTKYDERKLLLDKHYHPVILKAFWEYVMS
mgnify:CR=1 FL=1